MNFKNATKHVLCLLTAPLTDNRKEACEKVIRNKSRVPIRAVRMDHVGIARSGKTSFQLRMKGEIVNIKETGSNLKQPSTGIAEDGGQVFILKDVGVITSKVKAKRIWSIMKGRDDEARLLSQLLCQVPDPAESSSAGEHKASSRPSLAAVFTDDDDDDDDDDPIKSIIDETMEAGDDWKEIEYLLEDAVLISNIDAGGHAEFLDLQACLLPGASFKLIYCRLIDELDKPYKVYYTNWEGVSTKEEDSCYTEEDVIFQILSGIACVQDSFPSDKIKGNSSTVESLKSLKSRVMFMATYRDKVSAEEFRKKDDLLYEKIKTTEFYDKNIIARASNDHLMLEVNNMTGDRGEIQRIQETLERVIYTFDPIEIPVAWLVLSLYLRSKFPKLPLKECEAIAKKLRIDPEELQLALYFLHHRVGVLLYYPDIEGLKDTVFCRIQTVFESTSNLVKNTFTTEMLDDMKACDTFREKAQFCLEDIKRATSKADNLIPPEQLVKLLQQRKVLVTIPSTEPTTYFMPSILRFAPPSKLSPALSDSDPAPLMIRPDCGYVPVGIFPSMMACLVSQQGQWG